MPRIAYIDRKFSPASMEIIRVANEIVTDYQAQGLSLTLRQLYYRFIARAAFPNTEQSYKRLGSILNDARLAGLLDWNSLEDRTRNLVSRTHWGTPGTIIDGAARSYGIDLWEGQEYRVQVWVEKDALSAIVGTVAERWDTAYFACRGYVSQSEMWDAAQRFIHASEAGQLPVIIHLGDHDPSGIDMTRDIRDRLALFTSRSYADEVEVKRIALNMDQVEEHDPPPNPAKTTDARFTSYSERFGDESWELDALEPRVLSTLIEEALLDYLDVEMFEARQALQERQRVHLSLAASHWSDLSARIEAEYKADFEAALARLGTGASNE